MAAIHGIYWGWVLLALPGLYLLGALYVYAPLKIRRRQTKGVSVDYTPIELTALPPEVSQAFSEWSCGLASCGFHAIGHLTRHVSSTAQNSYISIWINPSACDAAQIIGVCTPSSVVGLRVATLATFRTEFTDGSSIVTSNSSSLSAWPPDPLVSSVRCPGIRDLGLLYRFHRARIERDRDGRRPTLERMKDPLSRMRWEHRDAHERLIRAGYYALDPTGQKYVPTIKGAYLMCHRLLPPFKQIQKLRRDQLADGTLRELGFGGMEAFRRAQAPPAPAAAF